MTSRHVVVLVVLVTKWSIEVTGSKKSLYYGAAPYSNRCAAMYMNEVIVMVCIPLYFIIELEHL